MSSETEPDFSNETETARAPAKPGAEAAAAYLRAHPPEPPNRGESYLRENPMVLVLGALVVGFALGRIAGQRMV